MITPSLYKAMNRRKAPFKPPEDKIIRTGESGTKIVFINGLKYEETWEKGGWVEIRRVE